MHYVYSKILQWNIWYKENPDNIVKEIKRINPDIVCAQEVIQDSRISLDIAEYIANELKYNYFFKVATTWSDRKEKETMGNAIFTRYKIKNTNFVYTQPLQHNPSKSLYEGRVYVEITIDINGIPLTVGTTHLAYDHKLRISQHRKIEINNLFKILSKKTNRFIFTADLNTTPSSYPVKGIEKWLKNAGPNYNVNSWTTKPFDYHGFKENDLNWRLDYIFATQDVSFTKTEIIETPYSDHLPILGHFKH